MGTLDLNETALSHHLNKNAVTYMIHVYKFNK